MAEPLAEPYLGQELSAARAGLIECSMCSMHAATPPTSIVVISRFRILVSKLRSSTSARDAEPWLTLSWPRSELEIGGNTSVANQQVAFHVHYLVHELLDAYLILVTSDLQVSTMTSTPIPEQRKCCLKGSARPV